MSSPSLLLVLLAFSSSVRHNNSSTFFSIRALTSDFLAIVSSKALIHIRRNMGWKAVARRYSSSSKVLENLLSMASRKVLTRGSQDWRLKLVLKSIIFFFGHNESGDQAAQITLFLPLGFDPVQRRLVP